MVLRARDIGTVLQELLGRNRCPEICIQYNCGHSKEAQVTLPSVLQKKEGRLNGRAAAQVLKTQLKWCGRGRGGACTSTASTVAGGAATFAEDDLALQFRVEIPPGRCCECASLGLPMEQHGQRNSLRCGGALIDLPSDGECIEEAIPVGVSARQMLQWLQVPLQAKPQKVALLSPRLDNADGDLACCVSDCVREATGWNPIVLAGLTWLLGCVAYGFRQVPGDPSVNPDLLYEQFQRRVNDIPVPPESPQYEQYRQYYLQQYEQHLQEHGALQEQWQQSRPLFNLQALLHSLGVGILIFAAVLAYCEYHYGTISLWMELAEEFWCNCQERWSKLRDPLGDSQRMENFLRELGEEEKPAAPTATAPSTFASSTPVAASRPAPREERRKPEPTTADPRSQAVPAFPPVPLPVPSLPLPKQPVLSSEAPDADSARKEQSPSSDVSKQRLSAASKKQLVQNRPSIVLKESPRQSIGTLQRPSKTPKAACEPLSLAPEEEPLREPSPERSQARDTDSDDPGDESCSCAATVRQELQQQALLSPRPPPSSWAGHMWEAAALADAGQVWEDSAGSAMGSLRLGSGRPLQDGSGNNVRERLRRKVVERNKEQIRSVVSTFIEPVPPKPKQAQCSKLQEKKRAVNGTELLREAEELFCQLEAESLLKQLAEEEERKKSTARKKAAKRKAAKGTEPGPDGCSVGEHPKQAGSSNSDDGCKLHEEESTKGEEAEEAKMMMVASEESCLDEDNTHSETPPSSEVTSTPVQDTTETSEGNVLHYLAEILEDGPGEVKQELMTVVARARRRKRERAAAPSAADRRAAPTQAAACHVAVPRAKERQEMQERWVRSNPGQSRITAGKPRQPFLPPAPAWPAQATEVEVMPPSSAAKQPKTKSAGVTEKVSSRIKNTFLEFEDETLNRQGTRSRASSVPCVRSGDPWEDFDSSDKVKGAKFAETFASSTVGAPCEVAGVKLGKTSASSKVAAIGEASLSCRRVQDSRRTAGGTSRNKAMLSSQRKEARAHDSRGKQSLVSVRNRRDANRIGVWDDIPQPQPRAGKETNHLGVWDDPPRRPTKATKPDTDDKPDPNLGQMFSPRGGRAAGALLLRAVRGDVECNSGLDAKVEPSPRGQMAATINEDGAASEAIVEETKKLEVHQDQLEQQQDDTSPTSAGAGTLRAEAPEFVPTPAFPAEQSMAAGMPVQMVPWPIGSMSLPEGIHLMPVPGAMPSLVLPPLNLPLPESGLASGQATPSPRDLADDMLTQQMFRLRMETELATWRPCSEAELRSSDEAAQQTGEKDAMQSADSLEE